MCPGSRGLSPSAFTAVCPSIGRFQSRASDLDALATMVLTTMEGGVLQSRSHRRIEPFDQSVAQLRNYFACLLAGKKKGVRK